MSEIVPHVGDYLEVWGNGDSITWSDTVVSGGVWTRVAFPIISIDADKYFVCSLKGTQYENKSWAAKVNGDSVYEFGGSIFRSYKIGPKLIPSGRRCPHCLTKNNRRR